MRAVLTERWHVRVRPGRRSTTTAMEVGRRRQLARSDCAKRMLAIQQQNPCLINETAFADACGALLDSKLRKLQAFDTDTPELQD